jgi:hypothetical protein
MCVPCANKHSSQGRLEIGTFFEERKRKKPETAKEAESVLKSRIIPLQGTELTPIEDQYMDDREIGCPQCGEARTVELDADYVYICEGCNHSVKVSDPMF